MRSRKSMGNMVRWKNSVRLKVGQDIEERKAVQGRRVIFTEGI